MSEIQLFENGEFELRIHEVDDSFIVEAPGFARALGMRDAYRLVESLPDEEKGKGYTAACTPDDQEIWHVTEPGFYRAIGQRQPARIKNEAIRAQVIRFQNWVYREVLPSLRRHGTYSIASHAPRELGRKATYLNAEVITFDEATAIYYQERGENYDVGYFTNILRAAGYLRQGGCVPRKKKRKFFHFNKSSWEIRTWALPLLFFEFEQTMRELTPRPWNQQSLFGGDSR
ncbi:BRO family protein [Nonomuraea sp. NPDC048901]|uniref:BRO-N domain-containing protein n=1 Tax=Nonomuraea sp. NPDC048901 TaxID=3155627 RepID=UPI00340F12B9